MKVVKKSQVKKVKSSDNCTAYEYSLGDKDIDFAVIDLKGRYPSKGKVVNKVCKELAFILEGSVILNVDGEDVQLEKGDEVLIMPNEKYFWNGRCKLLTACTPSWYIEQHKNIK
jgi:mannose-6-phosphate isomerase class I